MQFSSANDAHDQNDPALIADPNLYDPNVLASWDANCNLDATGTSQYEIDLADLQVFLSDDTPWLWIACWKLEQINGTMAMSGGGAESMMAQPLEMSAMSASTVEIQQVAEPEVSVDRLVQLVGFLDEVATNNPDNIEAIQKVREDLMDQIKAIMNK